MKNKIAWVKPSKIIRFIKWNEKNDPKPNSNPKSLPEKQKFFWEKKIFGFKAVFLVLEKKFGLDYFPFL